MERSTVNALIHGRFQGTEQMYVVLSLFDSATGSIAQYILSSIKNALGEMWLQSSCSGRKSNVVSPGIIFGSRLQATTCPNQSTFFIDCGSCMLPCFVQHLCTFDW